MSEKGRWFRVYARQVEEHPKFLTMTGIQLGAWLALRSAAELRDRATITDRAEAVLILKRRRIPKPAAVFDGLVKARLFDLDDTGRVSVHDRADHDRPLYPSDTPEEAARRKRESRAKEDGHDSGQPRDTDGHDTHAGVPPQQSSPASANSNPPQRDGLPGEADSATAACRLFVNGGHWLGNPEYVEAWDELDRRYTAEWVKAEIQPAYERLHSENPRIKPWMLKQRVELRCAERARTEELAAEEAQMEADRLEAERLRLKAENATDEDKRRASIMRRAVGLWIKRRPADPVPTDFEELEAWLAENETSAAA